MQSWCHDLFVSPFCLAFHSWGSHLSGSEVWEVDLKFRQHGYRLSPCLGGRCFESHFFSSFFFCCCYKHVTSYLLFVPVWLLWFLLALWFFLPVPVMFVIVSTLPQSSDYLSVVLSLEGPGTKSIKLFWGEGRKWIRLLMKNKDNRPWNSSGDIILME